MPSSRFSSPPCAVALIIAVTVCCSSVPVAGQSPFDDPVSFASGWPVLDVPLATGRPDASVAARWGLGTIPGRGTHASPSMDLAVNSRVESVSLPFRALLSMPQVPQRWKEDEVDLEQQVRLAEVGGVVHAGRDESLPGLTLWALAGPARAEGSGAQHLSHSSGSDASWRAAIRSWHAGGAAVHAGAALSGEPSAGLEVAALAGMTDVALRGQVDEIDETGSGDQIARRTVRPGTASMGAAQSYAAVMVRLGPGPVRAELGVARLGGRWRAEHAMEPGVVFELPDQVGSGPGSPATRACAGLLEQAWSGWGVPVGVEWAWLPHVRLRVGARAWFGTGEERTEYRCRDVFPGETEPPPDSVERFVSRWPASGWEWELSATLAAAGSSRWCLGIGPGGRLALRVEGAL